MIEDYIGKIIHGDCLEVTKELPDNSVDMILCDLPYGTTACSWDTVIPFEPLWKQYKRIRKDNTAIALTASQPFTTALINSNIDNYKYSWIWDKGLAGNIMIAEHQPMKITEDICIFYNHKYYPIKCEGVNRRTKNSGGNLRAFGTFKEYDGGWSDMRNPVNYLYFPNTDRKNIEHPTQKPVDLFRYLIRTYTNEGDLVLDNCSGSGTTAIACHKEKRRFICIEKESKYVELSRKRLKEEQSQMRLEL